MRSLIPMLAIVAIVMGLISATSVSAAIKENPKISILYTEPHPLINEIIAGFKAAVLRSFPKTTFFERHANGRQEEYGTAVTAGISAQPDLLAPITTPIAKITVDQARGRIPVVFLGITDPVGAGIARTLQRPVLATGSSDLCPFSGLLALARDVLPRAKTLGLPYNPSDQPAVYGRAQLIALAPKYGFAIRDEQVTSASELPIQVRGLATRVDAVLIGADNLMLENPSAVASSAAAAGKPTLSCDEPSVRAGAVAGIGVDYRQVGEIGGNLAVQVLRGKMPGDLPVAVLNAGRVTVNREAACRVRLTIPSQILRAGTDVSPPNFQCAMPR